MQYPISGVGAAQAVNSGPPRSPHPQCIEKTRTALEDQLIVLQGHEERLNSAVGRLRSLANRLFGPAPEAEGHASAPRPEVLPLVTQLDFQGRELTPLIEEIFQQIDRLERL